MENFIRFYDGALPAAFCREVIDRFEHDERTFCGTVTSNEGNVVITGKQTTELLISRLSDWADVVRTLSQSLFDYFPRYREEVKFLAGVDHKTVNREGFRLKRYRPGEGFEWHVDCSSKGSYTRALAVQWYFNSVEAGGHTEFQDQRASVASVEGRIAFFPVSWMYRHRGAPPMSGPKYICTNFLTPHFG